MVVFFAIFVTTKLSLRPIVHVLDGALWLSLRPCRLVVYSFLSGMIIEGYTPRASSLLEFSTP